MVEKSSLKGNCLVCLSDHLAGQICHKCKQEFSYLKEQVLHYKKQAEYYRQSWFAIDKENRKLKERKAKK